MSAILRQKLSELGKTLPSKREFYKVETCAGEWDSVPVSFSNVRFGADNIVEAFILLAEYEQRQGITVKQGEPSLFKCLEELVGERGEEVPLTKFDLSISLRNLTLIPCESSIVIVTANGEHIHDFETLADSWSQEGHVKGV
jgi:hypothetical protein